MNGADWIVVGGGSAGCVVASRLANAADPQLGRIVLIEPPSTFAPPVDRERPANWLKLLGSSEDWNLGTSENAALAKRVLRWPRGRGLGGSSRINAMIWFPPTSSDLQNLIDASGNAWSLSELQQELENLTELVRPEQPAWQSESADRFLEAVSSSHHGTAWPYLRLNRSGRRWNPAGLLTPGLTNDRIEIQRATVNRLVHQGDRVIGVEIWNEYGTNQVLANKGVILCAGAIATPGILMRSGIGNREQLQQHNIDVRIESDQVGQGLQDHLIMPVVFQVKSKPFPSQPSVRDIARWQTMGTGPLTSNLAECGGLFLDDSVQLHVTPTHYLSYPTPTDHAFMTIGVNASQPLSAGILELQSKDPRVPLLIHPNYLGHGSDRETTIRGIRLARQLVTETSLSKWIVSEKLPGKKRHSDEDLGRAISRYTQTLYHPAGTLQFGASQSCVVSPGFAIRGLQQAWIVDASVLPGLTYGNPNATIMLLALQAAKKIIEQTT